MSTPVLTALVKTSVFFSAFFMFVFFAISKIFRDVFLIGFKKSKNNKIPKQQKQKPTTIENKMQNKYKSNLMIQNKTRKQAEKKRKTKEQLARKSK